MNARRVVLLLLAASLLGCGDDSPRRGGAKPRAKPDGKPAAKPAPAPAPAPAPPQRPPLADVSKDLVVADPPAAGGALAPGVAWTQTTPMLTWLEPDPSRRGVYRLLHARWAAKKWGAPAVIVEGNLVASPVDVPALTFGPGTTLVAAWREAGARAGAANLALARTEGASWKHLGLAHDDGTATEHGFASLLPGDSVNVFWLDGRETATGGATALRMVLADADGALTGGAVLDPRVCDCCPTAAAVTRTGPIVVYRDRGDDEVRDISIVRRVGGAWTKPRPVHADGWRVPGCPVNGPAVAAYQDRVAVAWFTAAGDVPRVRIAFSDDGGASFGAAVDVDAPFERRVPLGRVDVELIGPDAVVSWVAGRRDDAALLLRRVAPDGQRSATLQIAAFRTSQDSGLPRMFYSEVDNELVFAWTDPGPPTRLRAARLPFGTVPAVRRDGPGPRPAPSAGGLAVGEPAPDLALRTVDGAPVTLASLRGKVAVVNLWATWCEPCRAELPALAKLADRQRARGLEVIGVSVDRDRAPIEVGALAARLGATYPQWHDPDDRSSTAFAVAWLPATFVIDRGGRVAWRKAGVVAADDPALERAVAAALAGE